MVEQTNFKHFPFLTYSNLSFVVEGRAEKLPISFFQTYSGRSSCPTLRPPPGPTSSASSPRSGDQGRPPAKIQR